MMGKLFIVVSKIFEIIQVNTYLYVLSRNGNQYHKETKLSSIEI